MSFVTKIHPYYSNCHKKYTECRDILLSDWVAIRSKDQGLFVEDSFARTKTTIYSGSKTEITLLSWIDESKPLLKTTITKYETGSYRIYCKNYQLDESEIIYFDKLCQVYKWMEERGFPSKP